MKKLFLHLFVLTLANSFSQSISAQSDSLKIEDLAAPVNPGFQILGISPQEISRPTSVTALQAYFLNSLTSPDALTDDFALEFSPYWLKDRPTLGFNCFYELESCEESEMERMFRSVSVSVASTSYETQTDSLIGRSWGIGGKITLIRGNPTDSMKATISINQANQNLQLNYFNLSNKSTYDDDIDQDGILELLNQEFDQARTAASNNDEVESLDKIEKYLSDTIIARGITSKDAAVAYFQTLFKDQNKVVREYLDRLKVQDLRRVGLNVDLSFGAAFVLPENDFGEATFDKYGAWITTTYTSKKHPSLSAALLVRRLMTIQNYGSTNTDLGLSFSLEKSRFTTNLEGIWRYTREEFLTEDINGNEIPTFNEEGTYRFTWNSSVNLTDDFKINASIGKDYDSEIRVSENFIALLGIGIDLFKNQYLKTE